MERAIDKFATNSEATSSCAGWCSAPGLPAGRRIGRVSLRRARGPASPIDYLSQAGAVITSRRESSPLSLKSP